jgi:BirA family biotin operon repressor/biotin-[acetyl-CoA-carboxylase] ligase
MNPYASVERALAGTPLARIEYRERTGSTNADAAARLGDERFAGTTIVAEFQERGAGRKGRAWTAQPGTALLFSTILPRAVAARDLWAVPFWAALAVRAVLLECGVGAELSWPNDLLLGGRKLAGILCQSRVVGDRAQVACGVGLNVHRRPGAAEGIDPPPAFCDDAATIERPRLLERILRRYAATLDLLEAPGSVAALWERAAGLPGRRYRLLKDGEDEPFEASAVRLADDGALVVERSDGRRETIALADARALR